MMHMLSSRALILPFLGYFQLTNVQTRKPARFILAVLENKLGMLVILICVCIYKLVRN